MKPQHLVYSGPFTVENLEQFSIDRVTSEFKQYAPELLELFQSLGKSTEEDPSRKIKVITSLCTLMKSRSKRGTRFTVTHFFHATSKIYQQTGMFVQSKYYDNQIKTSDNRDGKCTQCRPKHGQTDNDVHVFILCLETIKEHNCACVDTCCR